MSMSGRSTMLFDQHCKRGEFWRKLIRGEPVQGIRELRYRMGAEPTGRLSTRRMIASAALRQVTGSCCWRTIGSQDE